MLLDMIHSRIEVLVANAEVSKLGPERARQLLRLIREMADEERAAGQEEGRVSLKRRIELFADEISAPKAPKAGGKNGGRVHAGGARSTDT